MKSETRERDQEVIEPITDGLGCATRPLKHPGINQSIDQLLIPSIAAEGVVKSAIMRHHWLLVQKRRHERRCLELVCHCADSSFLGLPGYPGARRSYLQPCQLSSAQRREEGRREDETRDDARGK